MVCSRRWTAGNFRGQEHWLAREKTEISSDEPHVSGKAACRGPRQGGGDDLDDSAAAAHTALPGLTQKEKAAARKDTAAI